jgi:carbamoyltransferase
MPQYILGLSAYYHDSAAALLAGGDIVAAAHEERFTRKKHDASFPYHAASYVMKEAGIRLEDLDAVVFYDKPFIKFERLLETYHAFAPRGLKSFCSAMPVWVKEKLFLKKLLREELARLGEGKVPLYFPEHHLSHAASAFFPSPFEEAAILTVDGVGEWATLTIGTGNGNGITILRELDFPHSLGLLYSAFTYYTGFRVNSGEYKLMGLAPYGNPNDPETKRFKDIILNELTDIRDDGSLLLNMKYFSFATADRMTDDGKWESLFGLPPRSGESEITAPYMNMAMAIQQVTEEVMLKLAITAKQLTGSRHLVMAGGVALNSVANGKLLKSGLFDDIWIQPAAGDAGGAVGAAYAYRHIGLGKARHVNGEADSMKGAFLGPAYTDEECFSTIRRHNAKATHYDNTDHLCAEAARLIATGKVVGWFQGRMEFGPRALGNRSILGDARNPEMQKRMNLKIKHREGFRPFAPAVLEEDTVLYFDLDRPSPYMLLVVPVLERRRNPEPADYQKRSLYDRLYHLRSDIPAVTHVDYSARLQTVNRNTNPLFWKLLDEFKKLTGCSVIVNTSFNVRGEPIVCSPGDAWRCFMRTEMDYLVMGNFLLNKTDQDTSAKRSTKEEIFRPD